MSLSRQAFWTRRGEGSQRPEGSSFHPSLAFSHTNIMSLSSVYVLSSFSPPLPSFPPREPPPDFHWQLLMRLGLNSRHCAAWRQNASKAQAPPPTPFSLYPPASRWTHTHMHINTLLMVSEERRVPTTAAHLNKQWQDSLKTSPSVHARAHTHA